MGPCLYCGEPESVENADVVIAIRVITPQSCCEANLHDWLEVIRSWTRWKRAAWMYFETGIRVRDVIVSDEAISWVLDYGVRLDPVSFPVVRQSIQQHHRHLNASEGWKFGVVAFNRDEMVGVMTAERPVSAAEHCCAQLASSG